MALSDFSINGDSGNQGFDGTNAQVLTFALRNGTNGVRSWRLQVFDADLFSITQKIEANPPRQSPSAPELTLVGLTSGQLVSPATPGASINCTLPGSGSHAWIIRSIINGGVGPSGSPDSSLIRERMVVIRDAFGRRPIVATETTQYDDDGWASAVSEAILAGGNVSSVFSRTGAVVATAGDYSSTLITNASAVSGSTVTAALDALAAIDVANAAADDTRLDALELRSGAQRNVLWWNEDFEELSVASPLTVTTTPNFFCAGRGGWGAVALVSNGSVSVQAGEDNHPGIIRLTTGATNGSILRLYKGNLQTTKWVLGKNFRKFEIVARLNSTSASQLYVGLLDAAAGNSQLLMYYSAAVGGNWMSYAQKAGVDTATNVSTGVAADTNFHRFTIEQEVIGTCTYKLDGVLKNTFAANIPSTEGLNWTCDVYTNSGGAKSCDVDYGGFESIVLSR